MTNGEAFFALITRILLVPEAPNELHQSSNYEYLRAVHDQVAFSVVSAES